MKAKLAIWVFLVVVAIQGRPNTAVAYGPYFSGYGATAWDYLPGYTYLHVRNTIPYFALHPPVYYSHSVSRPYGFSPFAGFPGSVGILPTYQVSTQRVTAEPKPRRPAPKPLRIINPYVVQLGDPGVTPQATMPRQPQVIYPPAAPEAP